MYKEGRSICESKYSIYLLSNEYNYHGGYNSKQ